VKTPPPPPYVETGTVKRSEFGSFIVTHVVVDATTHDPGEPEMASPSDPPLPATKLHAAEPAADW
jgi:hypothetical protein